MRGNYLKSAGWGAVHMCQTGPLRDRRQLLLPTSLYRNSHLALAMGQISALPRTIVCLAAISAIGQGREHVSRYAGNPQLPEKRKAAGQPVRETASIRYHRIRKAEISQRFHHRSDSGLKFLASRSSTLPSDTDWGDHPLWWSSSILTGPFLLLPRPRDRL